jgi:nitrosocyanin
VLVAVTLFLGLAHQVSLAEAGKAEKFTLINVIFDGTKIWLPSTLIVHEGDTVELVLVNKLDAPHGFKIADFGVEVVVQPKAKATVRFAATKAGLHPFVCHLHPPHIGGQILVLEK